MIIKKTVRLSLTYIACTTKHSPSEIFMWNKTSKPPPNGPRAKILSGCKGPEQVPDLNPTPTGLWGCRNRRECFPTQVCWAAFHRCGPGSHICLSSPHRSEVACLPRVVIHVSTQGLVARGTGMRKNGHLPLRHRAEILVLRTESSGNPRNTAGMWLTLFSH
ncbi:hypothetical protein CEXT_125341 [Caerostris extrusa]|uniref:Uncharacterized protein n=1 Tax=Caerostris extrusa TaxID=172846 RepID=A0AAV4SSH2_CAEEX|nr:hypothetical protein CEXT_125341 [Caerostris extrusa]